MVRDHQPSQAVFTSTGKPFPAFPSAVRLRLVTRIGNSALSLFICGSQQLTGPKKSLIAA